VIRMPARKLRMEMSDALNRVAYGGERIIIERRGKPSAALVPVEDAAALEELENRADLAAARKALAEARRKGEKPIPWEKARKSLGL